MAPSRTIQVTFEQEEVRPEIIAKLRAMADDGTTVRDLVQMLHRELRLPEDSLLPVLWYLMKAFSLPLKEVLPIREWLGSANDEEIDRTILPAIRRARGKWFASHETPIEGQKPRLPHAN